MKMLIALLAFITALVIFTDTSRAGEWQEKPVMCGQQEEIFPMIAESDMQLVFEGELLGKVKDPDEESGLSPTPAILPFALYTNFDTGKFMVLEYHGAPYYSYCIIAFGENLRTPDYGAQK